MPICSLLLCFSFTDSAGKEPVTIPPKDLGFPHPFTQSEMLACTIPDESFPPPSTLFVWGEGKGSHTGLQSPSASSRLSTHQGRKPQMRAAQSPLCGRHSAQPFQEESVGKVGGTQQRQAPARPVLSSSQESGRQLATPQLDSRAVVRACRNLTRREL